MARDLFPIGPIAIAQFSSNVLVRFRYKSENGLIAFLAFVFRVIPLARPHLPAIERVQSRGIGVQRDRRQPYVGCGPYPFAQNALQLQQLSGQVQIQRGQKPPEHALPWQPAHLHDPGQHRVLGHKTKVVEASKPHVNSQHHPLYELIDGHDARTDASVTVRVSLTSFSKPSLPLTSSGYRKQTTVGE